MNPPTDRKQQTVVEKFTLFLNSHRLRKTPERFEILRAAIDFKGHFDVDCLYNSLETHGYHVSKATIYSTLELLCASGVIRKLLFDNHQARYEKAELLHSHLICTSCGEIREIDLGETDRKLSELTFDGFTSAYVSTCFYGLCDRCLKSQASSGDNC